MSQDDDAPPGGPFEIVEITADGPVTIAIVTSWTWAWQLVAMLNADLREQGRRFAFRKMETIMKGGTAG